MTVVMVHSADSLLAARAAGVRGGWKPGLAAGN
jgi:hypothetical protein